MPELLQCKLISCVKHGVNCGLVVLQVHEAKEKLHEGRNSTSAEKSSEGVLSTQPNRYDASISLLPI